MKKIICILIATVMATGVLSGCASKDNVYSDEEKQIIRDANQIISSEYDVTFDENDFSYSVGKQISENEFVSLDSKEKPTKDFENIVSVYAMKSGAWEDEEIYEYSVIFNSQTKEIVSITVNVE